MCIYIDENSRIFTENQLFKEFTGMRAAGEVDSDYTFHGYLNECLSKNGTLTRIELRTDDPKTAL